MGSGVIVSADGTILTNAHVVDGAETITVLLSDNKSFEAKLVGIDKPSDLAVLKIEAQNMPFLTLGNSDTVRVGDIVLAFETIVREAQAEEKSIGDHLSHLVIHGLLHLVGEDHETEDQAQRMEALETAALARLGIADPYAGSEPEPMQPRPAAKTKKPQPAS